MHRYLKKYFRDNSLDSQWVSPQPFHQLFYLMFILLNLEGVFSDELSTVVQCSDTSDVSAFELFSSVMKSFNELFLSSGGTSMFFTTKPVSVFSNF